MSNIIIAVLLNL